MSDLLKHLLFSFYVYGAVCMAVTQDVVEIKSVCGAGSALTCTAESKPGVQYRAVRWYKEGEPPAARLRGLVTYDLPNGTLRFYAGLEREVALVEDSLNIFLSNLTSSDSGVYVCHLAAPVGEQNREGRVLLTVIGCPDLPKEIPETDAFLVIFAVVVLLAALIIFLISYRNLRNLLIEGNKPTKKEILLDIPPKPLEPKELKLMYTLGPNWSKAAAMKHVCV